MIGESKFSKYLIYALGEIVLVVIGILFAVQINEWHKLNETKKSNQVYLTKIIEELHLNKERLDFLAFDGNKWTVSLDSAVANCDSLLRLSARGLEEPDLEFILNNKLYAGGSQLNLYDATYEELLNTGKLYTLGSDNVVTAIKHYYKRYAREVYYNKRWTDFALSGLNLTDPTYMRMELDYELDPEGFDLEKYPWFFQPNSDKYIAMQTGLKKMRNGQRHDLRKCKELKVDTEVLIAILEKELESRN